MLNPHRAVEDHKGQAIALTVENFYSTPSINIPYAQIQGAYPIGLVLAIREPYVHYGFWTGLPEIIVIVPTDFDVLRDHGDRNWRCESLVSARIVMGIYADEATKRRSCPAIQLPS
jgi:hypothetical protein